MAESILISPSLKTSGYDMTILYMPPNQEYKLKGKDIIICILRGNISRIQYVKYKPKVKDIIIRILKGNISNLNQYKSLGSFLSVGKSLLLENGGLLRSGENGCLLFVGKDEGDNNIYKDNISGMEIKWSEYDTDMYKTVPQIHVDKYRINLWYLGPNKHGGIHNHSNDPVQFVEFHTQLRGNGWMVKYEDQQGEKKLEKEVEMVRGYTHDLFCRLTDRKVTYPWHEYVAGENGTLFIVFEDTRI